MRTANVDPPRGAIPRRARSTKSNNSNETSSPTDLAAQARLTSADHAACKIPLPERLWQGHDLRAVIAASNFHVTEVMVLDGAGRPLRSDYDVREAFTAPWQDWDPQPDPPDDWPLIELSAPGVVKTKKGRRPEGREIIEPRRIRSFLDVAHVRASVVLEVKETAIETMRREFRLRPLPPRVPWTRNQAGDWQGWFMWPPTMGRSGDGDLPAGVRLMDRIVEAPLVAKDVPKRLARLDLPTLPLWLAVAAGGRDAQTTEECLLDEIIPSMPVQLNDEGFLQ
jgi:hypothetical protein